MIKTSETSFGVADRVTREELLALGVGFPAMSVDEKMKLERLHVRAVPTGEKRCPRKGEWYLSGAIVCAYRAHGDYSSQYHIARLIAVRLSPATYIPF